MIEPGSTDSVIVEAVQSVKGLLTWDDGGCDTCYIDIAELERAYAAAPSGSAQSLHRAPSGARVARCTTSADPRQSA
jgi:hypothetical protein